MSDQATKFNEAISRFDEQNAADPNRVASPDGPQAKELLYAQHMTRWLGRLYPDASEALRLAARAQHIRRWEIPRDRFPMDRAGYHHWRTTLYGFHADLAGRILREAGYDDATIARVGSLIRKERLKTDPEAQALEDVICLVFLENYFSEFRDEHADEEPKLINILRRTWAKMSPVGHEAALKLPLRPADRQLIEKALGPA